MKSVFLLDEMAWLRDEKVTWLRYDYYKFLACHLKPVEKQNII